MKTHKIALAAVLLALAAGVARADDGDDMEERREKVMMIEKHGMGPAYDSGQMHGGNMHGRHHGGPEMREKMEKVRNLEKRSRELAHQLHQAKDSEKAGIKAGVKKALGELFDARLALQQERLTMMERHLSEMKAKLDKRKAARESLIERRLAELSGDVETWD